MSDIYFFDSSAVAKIYLRESGTAWVISIITHYTVSIANITLAEVASAFEKKKRISDITQAEADHALNEFRSNVTSIFKVKNIEQQIINKAVELIALHGLRAYDAVQLASALQIRNERISFGLSDLIFVSADNALNEAAKAEGLSVENPNNH